MGNTRVYLKKGKERKVKNLYPWVYRDEVQGVEEGGVIADVFSKGGKFLGRGLYSRGARIVWRFLSRKAEPIDKFFFRRRIFEAYDRRKGISSTAFRVVFSESDFLGGLVVDRYNDGLVIQIRSRGMEEVKNTIMDVLVELFSPTFVYERSDMESRRDEGLIPFKGPLLGVVSGPLRITENGVEFYVDVVNGLKTGFYLDQRRSREYVASLISEGMRMLDLFSYTGGFSVYAALKGAKSLAVDTKSDALDLALENARLNGVEIETLRYDAFKFLEDTDETYDVIVADPPAISKRKGEREKILGALWKLTYNALPRLNTPGHLYICTCSYQASLEDMLKYVRFAATDRGIPLHIHNVLLQPPDHPFFPHFPESLYLKCVHAVKVSL